MLRCADDSLYTGIATDVERRVSEHVGGSRGAKYLKGRLPVTLVFRHEVEDRSVAQRLEARIKRLAKSEKERLIRRPGLLDELFPPEHADPSGGTAES
jgi:putative endonuclease